MEFGVMLTHQGVGQRSSVRNNMADSSMSFVRLTGHLEKPAVAPAPAPHTNSTWHLPMLHQLGISMPIAFPLPRVEAFTGKVRSVVGGFVGSKSQQRGDEPWQYPIGNIIQQRIRQHSASTASIPPILMASLFPRHHYIIPSNASHHVPKMEENDSRLDTTKDLSYLVGDEIQCEDLQTDIRCGDLQAGMFPGGGLAHSTRGTLGQDNLDICKTTIKSAEEHVSCNGQAHSAENGDNCDTNDSFNVENLLRTLQMDDNKFTCPVPLKSGRSILESIGVNESNHALDVRIENRPCGFIDKVMNSGQCDEIPEKYEISSKEDCRTDSTEPRDCSPKDSAYTSMLDEQDIYEDTSDDTVLTILCGQPSIADIMDVIFPQESLPISGKSHQNPAEINTQHSQAVDLICPQENCLPINGISLKNPAEINIQHPQTLDVIFPKEECFAKNTSGTRSCMRSSAGEEKVGLTASEEVCCGGADGGTNVEMLGLRLFSECSVDSNDSADFIVFGDGCPDDDQDLTEDESEYEEETEEDEEEVRKREACRRWCDFYGSSPPACDHRETQVRFARLADVHVMRVWDHASRRARVGPWEQAARDRDRFTKRIHATEPILAPVFTPAHRNKMWARLHQPR